MVSVPYLSPVAVGEKFALNLQTAVELPAGPNVMKPEPVLQARLSTSKVIEKSPVAVILEKVNGTACSFLIEKVCWAVLPTFVLLKVSERGLIVTGKTLSPCKATICGELGPSSVRLRLAVEVPWAVGL